MKRTFNHLFLILVIALMLLPFLATFNDFLTQIVKSTPLAALIEKILVPYEVRLVRTMLAFLGIETLPGTVTFVKNGVNPGLYLAWNCLGWQSFVILLVSLKTGLGGNFKKISVLVTVLFGLWGTFLINLLRITGIILIYYYFGRPPAFFLHDYISAFITLFWLFFFWWFSYSYVLEEKGSGLQVGDSSQPSG